jgi:DNA-binding transcriptional regulator of glucitol operon
MRKVAIFILIGILLSVGIAFAQQKFYGVVQTMPEQGYVGLWNIDGKMVNVTKDTKIKEKHGKLAVGSYVEVEGVIFEGKFIASEIETKTKK